MSTFTLANDLQNHRGHAESFRAYRARRRATNKALKLRLKGRLAYVSTEPVTLPLLGVDAKVDEAVLQGRLADVKLITLPGPIKNRLGQRVGTGQQVRIGRTKGVTFKYPVPRAQARAVALAARRDARA